MHPFEKELLLDNTDRNEFVDKIKQKIHHFDKLNNNQKKELEEFFQLKNCILDATHQNAIYKEALNEERIDLAMILVKNWSVNSKLQNSNNQTLLDIVYSKNDEDLQKQVAEFMCENKLISNNTIDFHNQQLQQRKKSLFSNIVSWIKKLFNFKSSQKQTRIKNNDWIDKNEILSEVLSTSSHVMDNSEMRPTKNSIHDKDIEEIEKVDLKNGASKKNILPRAKTESKSKEIC